MFRTFLSFNMNLNDFISLKHSFKIKSLNDGNIFVKTNKLNNKENAFKNLFLLSLKMNQIAMIKNWLCFCHMWAIIIIVITTIRTIIHA